MDDWHLRKLVSGGQTGVDRAALDAALALGLPCGGWCPRGRLAEDGEIPARYPLAECASADYAERTRLNVQDSDVTLVLVMPDMDAGTQHTLSIAVQLGRPALTIDLQADPNPAGALAWLAEFDRGLVVNVAGPRESSAPGIYAAAFAYLGRLLRHVPLDDDLDQLPGA